MYGKTTRSVFAAPMYLHNCVKSVPTDKPHTNWDEDTNTLIWHDIMPLLDLISHAGVCSGGFWFCFWKSQCGLSVLNNIIDDSSTQLVKLKKKVVVVCWFPSYILNINNDIITSSFTVIF